MNAAFKNRRSRIGVLTLALAALFILAAVRLTMLVMIDGPRLASMARSEHTSEIDLAAVRGPIVDRNGKPLALSAETKSVYARTRALLDNSTYEQRSALAASLGMNSAELEAKIHRRVPFVWLARHISSERASAVEELGLDGIGDVSEYKRFYPESDLAAAVVGLAGTDGQGLSGVELQYDKLVRGEPVELRLYHDALGHPILDSPMELKAPHPGARVELTIDAGIQSEAESYLAEQIRQTGAGHGAAVVLDPFTGEVLALADIGGDRRRKNGRLHDAAVQDAFEPGSTMKGILGAIALEDHVINTSREIYCENGEWTVGGRRIHDDSRHEWLNLGGIIEVSSNIGAAKIALATGAERFYRGMTAFGLGHKTGIDLPGEASGLIRPPSTWKTIELADHGFGQGVAVTPIQLATAYGAIANGGVLMRPFVVRAAYDASGNEILRRTPQALRRAVSPEVAHTMNHLLRGVVNGREGTARLARVADFAVAGKTGTAQMVNPDTGTYYQGRLVASFVGFLPADDPRLVILVVLYDVPHGHFGGLVAAPVFSEIASGALQRLDVPAPHPAFGTASLIPFESVGEPPSGPAESADQPSADTPDEYPPPSLMTVSADSQGRAPDFRGLSLRSAFALARAARVALEVTGNGYVVRQKPAPGGSLDASTVELTLSESAQSETESASSERRQSRHSKRAETGRKAFVIRRAEMLARVSG